jgi:hypothetical protein
MKKKISGTSFLFRFKEAFAIAALLLVGLSFYFPVIQGKIPAPLDTLVGLYHPWRDYYSNQYPRGIPFKNFLITDPVRQQIPWRKLAIDEWRKGRIPYYNATTFLGSTLLGNIQSGALYPLNIIFLIVPFPVAWTILIISETLLLLFFCYLFLRLETFSILASLFGAIVFSFSGFTVSWLTWGTIIHTALWLPLLLLLSKQIIQTPDGYKRLFATLGFLVALFCSLTAGHMQIFTYVMAVTVFYILFLLFRNVQNKKVKKESIKGVLYMVVAVCFLFSITFPFWKEFTAAFLASSRVADTTLYAKEGFFIPWEHILQFIAPDFFGNPATLNYWGKWNYGEFVGYIGIIPLIIAMYGFISRKISYWHAIFIFSVLLAFPTFLALLPYRLGIPILSSLQPTRLLFLIDFSFMWFTAAGIEALLNNGKKITIHTLFISFSGLFVVLYVLVSFLFPRFYPDLSVSFSVARRNLIPPFIILSIGWMVYFIYCRLNKKIYFFVFLLLGITLFDLFRFANKFTPFPPVEYFFPETKIIHFLNTQPRPFRVLATDDRILPPNVSGYYGIETVGGYDPVYSKHLEEFIGAYERLQPNIKGPFGFNRIIAPKQLNMQLLPLLNVRYILSLSEITDPSFILVMKEGETYLYRYIQALPRAYFVGLVLRATSDEEEMKLLYSNAAPSGAFATVRNTISVQQGPTGTALVTSYGSGKIQIQTHTESDQFLVVSQAYTLRWKAMIDSVPAKIIPADYILLGMVVPKGDHSIVLSYEK